MLPYRRPHSEINEFVAVRGKYIGHRLVTGPNGGGIGHRLVTVMQIGQGLVTGGGGRHFGHSLVIYFDVI